MLGDIKRRAGFVVGASRRALESPRRTHRLAHKRQLVMTLCRFYTDASLPKIGNAFNRNHATVMFGIDAVTARCADPEYFQKVAQVCAVLESEILHRLKVTQGYRPVQTVLLLPAPRQAPYVQACPSRRIMVPA